MPYTYILECADNTYYTGWTTNLAARLAAHNCGSGARYTRGRLPVHLVYAEYQPTVSEACKREARIKRLDRSAKTALIKGGNSLDCKNI
ncbi:MAG: nuclease superfamily protein [Firmicutes bacterium]|nr:nuclease superfamily protein [Bacillota bacterium]